MPFTKVSEETDSKGGNFPVEARKLFNYCGANYFHSNIAFTDASHSARVVPVFYQTCLKDDDADVIVVGKGKDEETDADRARAKARAEREANTRPETAKLVTTVRQAMRGALGREPSGHFGGAGRSIHQNSAGYLPYSAEGGTPLINSALNNMAKIHGTLPNNQASKGSTTKGKFLEITCGDDMHVYARLVVDYHVGIVYITLGHYHPDSFAMLIRSDVELKFEIAPVLAAMGANLRP